MQRNFVWFTIISILFQCIQGTVHLFNAKQPWLSSGNDDLIYRQFERHATDNLLSGRDDDIAVGELPKLLRVPRQETGGTPEAYSSQPTIDDRQFGKLAYSGEGSKVITVPNMYL